MFQVFYLALFVIYIVIYEKKELDNIDKYTGKTFKLNNINTYFQILVFKKINTTFWISVILIKCLTI